MELLSPAGSVEKLEYSYLYGADAAYIGLKGFSLRAKADNFGEEEADAVRRVKARFPGKRLYCALNIMFHNDDIARLCGAMPLIRQFPIDAFIVQDLGIVPVLQREMPSAALHLSTQASCVNAEAVRMYRSMSFKRITLGREASLKEAAEIKSACPDMEIECFVHGAMCIAYSGRCLMSAYMSGRSAEEGLCAHSCRWDYELCREGRAAPAVAGADAPEQNAALALRERERPDEYYPVFEGEGFTAVLSSKDLCMIDSLADFKKAGVDSLKIEGRMKSVYYTAVITRAYRKALDALEGRITDEEASPFINEIYNVSHRAFSHGFYYNKEEADVTVSGESRAPFALAAKIGRLLSAEEEAAVFEKARSGQALRDEQDGALCAPARAALEAQTARDKDFRKPFIRRREGFRMYALEALNMIRRDSCVELVSPGIPARALQYGADFYLLNPDTGEEYNWVCNGHPCALYTKLDISDGSLLRVRESAIKTADEPPAGSARHETRNQ